MGSSLQCTPHLYMSAKGYGLCKDFFFSAQQHIVLSILKYVSSPGFPAMPNSFQGTQLFDPDVSHFLTLCAGKCPCRTLRWLRVVPLVK